MIQPHEQNAPIPAIVPGLAGATPVLVRRRDDAFWSGPVAEYRHADGDRVPSVDPDTCSSAWAPVLGLDCREQHPGYVRVRTESGRRLDLAADAGVARMGPDGRLRVAAVADLDVGRDRLPVVRPVLPEVPEGPRDRDEGRLGGLYLSEGHAPPSHPGCVSVAVADDGRAAEVLGLISRLGHRPYRNGGAVNFTDHPACRRLLEVFGHRSHAKRVPAGVLARSRAYLGGLVEGYFGGDGCLWADGNGAIQLAAVSVSPAIRDGMVDLLAALGVFATRFDAPRNHIKAEWRDGYGLRVISRHIARLGRWFVYEDRQGRLADLARASYRASTFEHVPVPRAARKALYAAYPGRPPHSVYKTAHLGAVARHRLAGCSGPFGAWAGGDVLWDRVVAVDPAPEPAGRPAYALAVAGGFHAAGHGLLVAGSPAG